MHLLLRVHIYTHIYPKVNTPSSDTKVRNLSIVVKEGVSIIKSFPQVIGVTTSVLAYSVVHPTE